MYLLLLYFLNPQQILRLIEIHIGFECDHKDLNAAYHAQNNLFLFAFGQYIGQHIIKKMSDFMFIATYSKK